MPDRLINEAPPVAPLRTQAQLLRARFPILFYSFIATWIMILVLAVGVAVFGNRLVTNSANIRAGTCVIVATLEQGARDAQATLDRPAAPLAPDRVEQLERSVQGQRELARRIRDRVMCPEPTRLGR